MVIPCEIEGCNTTERDRANLHRHMFTSHWPWQVRQYLCGFCKKGYTTDATFQTHIETEAHLTNRQLILENGGSPFPVLEASKSWIEAQWQAGHLSMEFYQKLLTLERVTSITAAATPTSEGYVPQYIPTMIQRNADEAIELGVLTVDNSAISNSNDMMQYSVQYDNGSISPRIEQLAATLAANGVFPSGSTVAAVTNTETPKPAGRLPSKDIKRCHEDATEELSHMSHASSTSSAHCPPSPLPLPEVEEHPAKKQKLLIDTIPNLTIEGKLISMAEAIDTLTETIKIRLDTMEQNLKFKLKDFTEAQSADISAKIEGECFKVKKFEKDLCQTLQNDLYRLLSNPK